MSIIWYGSCLKFVIYTKESGQPKLSKAFSTLKELQEAKTKYFKNRCTKQ